MCNVNSLFSKNLKCKAECVIIMPRTMMIEFVFSKELVRHVMNIGAFLSPNSITTNRDFESFSKHCSIFCHVDDIEPKETCIIGTVPHFEIEPLSIGKGVIIKSAAKKIGSRVMLESIIQIARFDAVIKL